MNCSCSALDIYIGQTVRQDTKVDCDCEWIGKVNLPRITATQHFLVYPKFAAWINFKRFRTIPYYYFTMWTFDRICVCKRNNVYTRINAYSQSTYLARSASCLSLGQTFWPLLLPRPFPPPSKLPPVKKFIFSSMYVFALVYGILDQWCWNFCGPLRSKFVKEMWWSLLYYTKHGFNVHSTFFRFFFTLCCSNFSLFFIRTLLIIIIIMCSLKRSNPFPSYSYSR